MYVKNSTKEKRERKKKTLLQSKIYAVELNYSEIAESHESSRPDVHPRLQTSM